MQPVKPEKSSIMQLLKPPVAYKYKRLCSNKNCQSTRCYKKECPVRPVCNDRNYQSANLKWNLNLKELISFSYVDSDENKCDAISDKNWL